MEKVLTEVCTYLNNYFCRSKHDGKITISGGTFTADYLQSGQYFRIVGSTFNDGVHKYPATTLHDEAFDGSIWAMAVPETVTDLVSEIKDWETKYAGVDSPAMSPFTSESFSGYSYSKSGSGTAGSGSNIGWQDVFKAKLDPYRRLRGAR